MEGLKLDLEARKTEVIRGESIRFNLVLTNTGQTPLTLKDNSGVNRSFSIHVTGIWGVDAWGDQMSIHVREGEHVDQPRSQPTKVLAPGDKWAVQGDVISWIGELEPSTYSLQGHYMHSPSARAESSVVEVKVTEAAPVYAGSATQNLPLVLSPRVTAWIHRTGSTYRLFVLESSPNHPPVTYANIPLAEVDVAAGVLPSSYNVAPPTVQHMVWTANDGSLRVLRFRSDLPPEAPISIPLPSEDLEPMATPYTDPKGNLHVLLVNPGGENACLLQHIGKGKPAIHPIKTDPPLTGPRSAIWCRDEVLAFAWADPEGIEVFAATVPLSSPPQPITGKLLFTADQPVIDFLLAQVYNEAREDYDRVLHVLSHDLVNDIFLRWKINLADGNAEPDGRFVVDGAGNLQIIQSVLTDDGAPLYLFARPDGAIVFADSSFTAFLPVTDASHRPVKANSQPYLVVPTGMSRIPGRFVRFIEQGKRFAYARLA